MCMNQPEIEDAPPTKRIEIRREIPLWRMTLYYMVVAILLGVLLERSVSEIWPSYWRGALIAGIGLVYGLSAGERVGVRRGRHEAAVTFDAALRKQERAANEQIEELKKDIRIVEGRIERQMNEGEEWKRPKRRHPEDE